MPMTTWLRPQRLVMNLPILLGLACSEPGSDIPGVDSAGEDDGSSGGAPATSGNVPTDPTMTTTNEPGAADTAPATSSDEPTTGGSTGGSTGYDGVADSHGASATGNDPTAPPSDPGDGGDPGDTGGDTGDGGGDKPGEPPPPPANATDENLLVALVGDQGSGSDTKAVYQLILDEKADMLILLGDFDYGDDPDGWADEMNSVLGDSFPVFAAVGNHDVGEWDGYQAKLQTRLEKIAGAECNGELGVKTSCKYRGLHFLLSGIGTLGSKSDHEDFIEQTLAADDSLWSLCVWHKNMRDMQAGDKPDEVTWKALQLCQNDGSIVVMGHEHSYSRTRTLTDVGNKANDHGATGMPELLEVGPGSTFSVVSGLGGKGIRAYEKALHDGQKWWASIYTSDFHLRNGAEIKDFDADSGVMFVRFHVDGDPNSAHGYFKNIKGQTVDEFDVVRK